MYNLIHHRSTSTVHHHTDILIYYHSRAPTLRRTRNCQRLKYSQDLLEYFIRMNSSDTTNSKIRFSMSSLHSNLISSLVTNLPKIYCTQCRCQLNATNSRFDKQGRRMKTCIKHWKKRTLPEIEHWDSFMHEIKSWSHPVSLCSLFSCICFHSNK